MHNSRQTPQRHDRLIRWWLIIIIAVLTLPGGALANQSANGAVTFGHPAPLQAGQGLASGWYALDRNLQAVAPSVNFLAAEVRDGACLPIHGFRSDERLALASVFKLYILAELAAQVEAGLIGWDEPLRIQDRFKSLPSGAMRDLPAGTALPVRYYAERMIAESDNTATDHLIERLGRENIERSLSRFGHGAPELNMPFLMTREMFAFKAVSRPDRVQAYLAAPLADKRVMLSQEIQPIRLDLIGWGDWVGPEHIQDIEWFASAEEVCSVLAILADMSGRPGLAPIRDILGLNAGPLAGNTSWRYAGYKGGFEAGVFNLTWLLEGTDGRLFVITAGFNDPTTYVNQSAAIFATLAGADLLASTPRNGVPRPLATPTGN